MTCLEEFNAFIILSSGVHNDHNDTIRLNTVTVLQRFIPIKLRRRPRVSENSIQETPQYDVK